MRRVVQVAGLLLAAGLLGFLAVQPRAEAATNRAWVGGASGTFDNPNNWSPKGVPVDGDVLIFHGASNGNAYRIDVFANMPNLRIASITTDIEELWFSGPVRVTKSVFVEKNQRTVTFGSLSLDSPNVEFSAPPIPFMAYPGAIVVTDTLVVGGTLSVHGGLTKLDHLTGNGLITLHGTDFVAKDFAQFSGPISAADGSEMTLLKSDFTDVCDRSHVKLLFDATSKATFDPSCTQVFASLEGPGKIGRIFGTSEPVNLKLVSAAGTFNGSIDYPQASVSLECCGTGAQRIGGDMAGLIQVNVTGGSLNLEDGLLHAGTITDVVNGASLGGFGIFGNVSVDNGTLAPGGGAANFDSLSFTSSGGASFAIGGSDPASIGQVKTKGLLDLGSASNAGTAGELNVQFVNGFVPPVGQPLVLIAGASEVQGTFKELPEGASATFGGYTFKITYLGGASGHDVVLTRLAGPGTPTPPAPNPSLKYRRFVIFVGRDD